MTQLQSLGLEVFELGGRESTRKYARRNLFPSPVLQRILRSKPPVHKALPLPFGLLPAPEVLQEMNPVGHGRGCGCQSHRAPHRCYRGGMEAKGTSYYKARSGSGCQEVCEVQGMLFGGTLGRTSCSATLRSSTLGPAGSLGFWSENP